MLFIKYLNAFSQFFFCSISLLLFSSPIQFLCGKYLCIRNDMEKMLRNNQLKDFSLSFSGVQRCYKWRNEELDHSSNDRFHLKDRNIPRPVI